MTNEAVNLKIRVAGSGNLKLVETPKFEFPSSFDVFDPKISDRITTTSQGMTGSRTFEFVAIPRGPGKFDFGTFNFTYFDPVQEKYVTLKSKSLALIVEPDGVEDSGMQMVGFGREDVKFLGQDIRFIKTDGINLSKNGFLLIGSTAYMVYLFLLIIIFVVIFWIIQYQRKLMGNVALLKVRQAKRMAKKRLKKAQHSMNNSDAEHFYEELLKALWGYISDKLNIPVANLSSESARETLLDYRVEDSDIEELMRIISACEYARYAPKEQQSQMSELYDNAIELISKMESVLGK